MTASNLPSWAANVQCGINAIALHNLIGAIDLDPVKMLEVEEKHLDELPHAVILERGVVKPAMKIGIDGRVHTHGTFLLQSIPRGWRPAITVTDPDNRLIDVDVTACHWQIVAYQSGDPDMIAFWEQPGDFYDTLPVTIPTGAPRSEKKLAVNIYMNGGAAGRISKEVGWSFDDSEAFVETSDALWAGKWTTAGAWVEARRQEVYVEEEWRAHRRAQSPPKPVTVRAALGCAMMRAEAALLNKVFNHAQFAEQFHGRVVVPNRDGFLVECPEGKQDELAEWLAFTIIAKITNETDHDRDADNHVHLDCLGTSWGQVDGEDVTPLVGIAIRVAAANARRNPSADDKIGLLLATGIFPDHMANYYYPPGRGRNTLKQAVARASNEMSKARRIKENRDNPPPPVDPRLPTLNTVTNQQGVTRVDNTNTNLHTVLTSDPRFALWFNEWDKEVYNGEGKVDLDSWEADLFTHCEQTYNWKPNFGFPMIKSATAKAAKEDCRHPLRDDIDALKWDGHARIDTWLQDAVYPDDVRDPFGNVNLDALKKEFGISEDEYELTGDYGRMFLLGMMQRLYTPGKLFDTVLVLAGLLGVGKGRMFKALAGESADGESYYSGTARHKDTAQAALQGLRTWVWEDQEMNNHKGAGSDKAKQWVSEAVDLCRLPYGKKVQDLKRHFVPCGSTNDPMKLLSDPSGSRRYHVVRIPVYPHQPEDADCQPEINVEGVEAVRDQLLAEARDRFQKGERFHLKRGDKNFRLRAKVNKTMFTATSDLDDFVAGIYRRNSGGLDAAVSIYEVYSAYAGEDAKRPDMLKGRAENALVDALRKADFQKEHTRTGNVWVKHLTEEQAKKVRAVNKGLYSSASDKDFKGKPFAKAGDDGYFDANFR